MCGQRWTLAPEARGRIASFVNALHAKTPGPVWATPEIGECGIAVEVPSASTRSDQVHTIANTTANIVYFELPADQGAMNVTCFLLPKSEEFSVARVNAIRDGMLRAIGVKLVSESEVPRGRELRFEMGGAQGLGQIRHVGSRVVTAVAMFPAGADPGVGRRFIDSVHALGR